MKRIVNTVSTHWFSIALLCGAYGGWIIVLLLIHGKGHPPGADFYQVWLGARALLAGENPYGEAVRIEMRRAYQEWGQHGLPYPLPALIAITPFALLPLHIAVVIWIVLCLFAIALLAFLKHEWRLQLALPLLFLPVTRLVDLRQPTLMWIALGSVLVIAFQRRWSLLAGLCLALLPAKPQAGLVLALVGFLWAIYNDRQAVRWGVVWGIIFWGGAFVLLPTWIQDCLVAIAKYRALYNTFWLLPLGALCILASMHLPWWAIAATAQAVLFPTHEIYGLSPLLIAWFAIGGRLALIGTSISWGFFFFIEGLISSPQHLMALILVPYLLAAMYRGYQHGLIGEAMARLSRFLPARSMSHEDR